MATIAKPAIAVITAEEKLKCAEREAKMRHRVYPRWVDDGRMTMAQAQHEIAVMEAIADDYREAAQKERLI